MIQLLLKVQNLRHQMDSEFRENIIISTNVMMYIMILLHLIILLFDFADVSDEGKSSIQFFAIISFFALILQAMFTKFLDILYDFFKNHEIKKKQPYQ